MSELAPRPRAALAFAAAAAAYTLAFSGFAAYRVSRGSGPSAGLWPSLLLLATVSIAAAALVGAAAGPWFAARAGCPGSGLRGGTAVTAGAFVLACLWIALVSLRPGGFFGASTAFGPGLVDVGPARVFWAARMFGPWVCLLPALPLGALAGFWLVWPPRPSPAGV